MCIPLQRIAKHLRPVINGVSTPGDRKRGHWTGETLMATLEPLEVKDTGKKARGNLVTGHPAFVCVTNASKAIPLHFDRMAKADTNHQGVTKRIKIERKDHISTYDLSENPKATIL